MFTFHQLADAWVKFANKVMSWPIKLVSIFDLIFIMIENSCSHSHAERRVSSVGTPGEASEKYEETVTSRKFIKKHPLCFVLLSAPPYIYELLLLPILVAHA